MAAQERELLLEQFKAAYFAQGGSLIYEGSKLSLALEQVVRTALAAEREACAKAINEKAKEFRQKEREALDDRFAGTARRHQEDAELLESAAATIRARGKGAT